MTTVVLDAYRVTSATTVVNGVPQTDQVDFERISMEFVIGAEADAFSWTGGGLNPTVVTQNGDVGEIYEIRLDWTVIDLASWVEVGFSVDWGSNQSTDAFAFGYDDATSAPNESTSLIFQLGGDYIDLDTLAEYQAWQTTATNSALTSGPFAAGQTITYSNLLDFGSISENDVVIGNPAVATTYYLGIGNDTFTGSSANERVYSGKGTDTISLGDGNDYVRVGGGQESFDGGAGKDYISYYDSTGGITANLAANTVSGSWAVNDTINSFESISGSKNGGDHITGTSGSNNIYTFGGNDKVYAGKGTDKVELGSGNDYVRVGGGQESFDGGSGNDYISYYDSSNGIMIDLRDDEVSGSWAVNDTIKDFESASGSKTGDDEMHGTSGANTFRGYGGDDVFYGRGGADKLYGGDGEDFFDGGAGSGVDQLWGGADADVFHFDKGEGVDIVKDFENNIDEIQLDNFGFNAATAFTFADQVGTDVVFDFGADGMLTIENATIGQLQNDLVMV